MRRGDEAGAELLLHQRVVLGEELEGSVAEEVGAAVADVGDPEGTRGGFPESSYERGRHTAEHAQFLGALEDGLIGSGYGLPETGFLRGADCTFGRGGLGCGRCLFEAVEEGLAGELAGYVTGGCSTYTVADDEDAVFGKGGAGVLIDMPDAATIGAHGVGAGC